MPRTAQQTVWALGDYHRFATATVWELGPVLVKACGITAGQQVLDVAAGTGNAAIRAAQAGAHVVASDLTPEHFDAGREAARQAGVELEWVEADAQALPFDAGRFDVVTSLFGAIFAPDHQATANELLRVCRPGGTIGLLTFVPEAGAADFFALFARYAPPPPPGAQSPLLWGTEPHLRALFGDRLGSLELTRRRYVERAPSARAYLDLFKTTFGPLVALYDGLAGQPARAEALDREFLAFVERQSGTNGGPIEVPYDYLVVVARTRAAEMP